MVDTIPFFQHFGRKRRAISSVLSFPWVEVVPGSQLEHAIGDDVLGAIIDEANIRGVAKSLIVKEAQDLFMEIRMRSETTFSINGKWAGFSAIISTAGKSTSFTDMEVAKAKRDYSRFLVEAAVYDVNPQGYSKERFLAYPGDGTVPAFIVDAVSVEIAQTINSLGTTVEQFINEHQSVMVSPPMSLRHFYEENIETALQNLSGVTRVGSSLFVKNKSIIGGMFDSSMRYPTQQILRDGIPFLGLYDTLLPEELINEEMINEVYSGEPVYAAFDISRVNDATGFSAIFYSEDRRKILPVLISPIYLDRLKEGNEIDQVKLMGLVTALFNVGVNFQFISADGFSSEYILQRCKLLLGNDKADRFSVDKSPAAHITMLNFMKMHMYQIYPIPRLKYELENLVFDPYVGKVDHPANSDPANPVYFKDVSDSLAAASFHLSVRENLSYESLEVEAAVQQARSRGAKEDKDEEEDFYSGLEDGEDFYSDIETGVDEKPVPEDPVERLMRDIMS
jgi:hypothetical protein